MTPQEKFHEKLSQEYNDYLDSLRKMYPQQIIDKSYETVAKLEILLQFEDKGLLPDSTAQILLDKNVGLEDFYKNWMDSTEGIRQAISENVASKVFDLEHEDMAEMLRNPDFMPDTTITKADMEAYGYNDYSLMLPLKAQRAAELYNQGQVIFKLFSDATEAEIESIADLEAHTEYDGIFGIESPDWYESKEYQDLSAQALKLAKEFAQKLTQKQTEKVREQPIMPDPTITIGDMQDFGYLYEGEQPYEMLPLRADRAAELFSEGHEIFKLYGDNGEAAIESLTELDFHAEDGSIFGITYDEWTNNPAYQALVAQAKAQSISAPETPKNEIPVYKDYLDVAVGKGEKPLFYQSQKLNHECGQAIDAALSANSQSGEMAGGQYVDSKQAARNVIAEYGAERVAWVLAGNVNVSNYDGRWSNATKEWASGFDIPENSVYHLNSHRTKLDAFAENYRKLMAEAEQAKQAQPTQSDYRTYKAELSTPHDADHMEIILANDDEDAVNQAYEFEDEEGVFLQELHELDSNYNIIREVNLLADHSLRRFMDVDLIDFLGKIADKVVVHYPQDFSHDVEVLWKKALSENPAEQKLMWHCSSYGTHTLKEDEVFIRNTGAYGYWVDYRPNEPDMTGYVIEVTGCDDVGDSVVGNVYEVGEYKLHAQYVRENSIPLDAVSLTYDNTWGINAGKTITVPRYEYDKDRHRLMSESGDVAGIKYHAAESVRKMADVLQSEQQRRMCMQIGDTDEHLQKIDAKMAELRDTPEKEQSQEADSVKDAAREVAAPTQQERQPQPQTAENAKQSETKTAAPENPKKDKKAYRSSR